MLQNIPLLGPYATGGHTQTHRTHILIPLF